MSATVRGREDDIPIEISLSCLDKVDSLLLQIQYILGSSTKPKKSVLLSFGQNIKTDTIS